MVKYRGGRTRKTKRRGGRRLRRRKTRGGKRHVRRTFRRGGRRSRRTVKRGGIFGKPSGYHRALGAKMLNIDPRKILSPEQVENVRQYDEDSADEEESHMSGDLSPSSLAVAQARQADARERRVSGADQSRYAPTSSPEKWLGLSGK